MRQFLGAGQYIVSHFFKGNPHPVIRVIYFVRASRKIVVMKERMNLFRASFPIVKSPMLKHLHKKVPLCTLAAKYPLLSINNCHINSIIPNVGGINLDNTWDG